MNSSPSEFRSDAGRVQFAIYKGEVLCFTGTLRSGITLSRKKAIEEVLRRGGQVRGTLTRDTTILVRGTLPPERYPSEKLQRAASHSIRIISASEFFSSIGFPFQLKLPLF